MASTFNCLALIICMALGASMLATANLTCCKVKPTMDACKCYVTSGGNVVPQKCCLELMNLKNNVMNSALHRRQACRCIVDAARKLPNLNTTAFSSLPDNCGIRLPYGISVDMNCNKYNTISLPLGFVWIFINLHSCALQFCTFTLLEK